MHSHYPTHRFLAIFDSGFPVVNYKCFVDCKAVPSETLSCPSVLSVNCGLKSHGFRKYILSSHKVRILAEKIMGIKIAFRGSEYSFVSLTVGV